MGDKSFEPLPSPQRDHAMAVQRTVGYWRALGPEMVSLDDVGAALPTGPEALGTTPLRILIATGGGRTHAERAQVAAAATLRAGLVDLSTDAHFTELADASHITIVTEERHARRVGDTIGALLEDVR